MEKRNGNYSVPEEIRALKPKGTEVKKIHGNYYVYKHYNVKGADGIWHKKSGPCIGAIKPGIGFIPNDTKNQKEETTTLEYGQYAVAFSNSQGTLSDLKEIFNSQDAYQIYIYALILAVNGSTPMKNIKKYFIQSWLSIRFPSLKLGEAALGTLLDTLGRQQGNVNQFQEKQLMNCSSKLAVDGHVIRSCSKGNDLAAFGNKYGLLKATQINLLTVLDVNTHKPVASKMYRGNAPDKSSVKDLIDNHHFTGKLFIVDKGFYSAGNLRLFSQGGNHYIIPIPIHSSAYKQVTKDMDFEKRFIYRSGKTKTTIEYREFLMSDGQTRIFVYRDINRNAAECESYERHLRQKLKGFSREEYDMVKEFFGTIVLQTSQPNATAQEVYGDYKGRWSIETYYDFFKNVIDFNAIGLSDYYKMEGFTFIMLIASMIQYEIGFACANYDSTMSVADCLLEARIVKINKRGLNWYIESSMPKKTLQFLEDFHVESKKIPVA